MTTTGNWSYSLPKPHYSFSQHRLYRTCPACYEAEYIKGIPRPIGSALIVGIAAHDAMERLRRAVLTGSPWPIDQVVLRAQDAARAAVTAKIEESRARGVRIDLKPFSSEGQLLDASVRMGVQACKVAWAYDRHRPVIAIELELPCIRPGTVFGFSFKARADALHADGGISDLKTLGWWRRDRDVWALKQMSVYAMPGYMATGVIPRCEVLLAEKRDPFRLAWYPATPTLASMREMWMDVESAARSISSGDFPAQPNRWCHVPHPARNHHVMTSPPSTPA